MWSFTGPYVLYCTTAGGDQTALLYCDVLLQLELHKPYSTIMYYCRWSSTSPHHHQFNSLQANYCRNPDGTELGVWCFTMDHRSAVGWWSGVLVVWLPVGLVVLRSVVLWVCWFVSLLVRWSGVLKVW